MSVKGFSYYHNAWSLKTNFSTGFRYPHLSELLASGFHHGAMRYEIGNSALTSEKAIQTDINIEVNKPHFTFFLNPYFNYIRNFISLVPSDSVIQNFPVYSYEQISFAGFYGFDVGCHFHPHFLHSLHLESVFSIIQVSSSQTKSVAMIPQPRWNNTLTYEFKKNNILALKSFQTEVLIVGKQNNVALNEAKSSGYHLINSTLNFENSKDNKFTWSIGCKNIFNVYYIDHLSRLKNLQLPAMGRNIFVSLKYTFSVNK